MVTKSVPSLVCTGLVCILVSACAGTNGGNPMDASADSKADVGSPSGSTGTTGTKKTDSGVVLRDSGGGVMDTGMADGTATPPMDDGGGMPDGGGPAMDGGSTPMDAATDAGRRRDAAVADTGAMTDAVTPPPPVDAGPRSPKMSFFVTSAGLGKGGNLGGLNGADAHCKALAMAAGSTKTQWAAYLSIESGQGGNAVNARDRIGAGPWFNFAGLQIAASVDQLHSNNGADNALSVDNSLDENGAVVPGVDAAKRPPGTMLDHDILTGSTADGMVMANSTCNDWTSNNGNNQMAQVGHSDKDGPNNRTSWNSAHASGGCAEGRGNNGVGSGGGSGRLYCFAKD